VTAQFLSRDPAAAMTGEPYGYVADNPLNGSDPTGLSGGLDSITESLFNPGRFKVRQAEKYAKIRNAQKRRSS
jgi:hypothetical protein